MKKIALSALTVVLVAATVLLLPSGVLEAGSGQEIASLDDGAPGAATDRVEISRNVFSVGERWRPFYLELSDLSTYITGTGSYVLTTTNQSIAGDKTFTGSIIRTGQEHQVGRAGWKVGATAGWAVSQSTDLFRAALIASQTGSTMVIPVDGLKVGATITGFKVEAQIESAGNTVTLDADLRKQTNAAADPVDASVGAITQVSVTADTKVEASKTGLSDTIAADEWFYILVTGTTGASTDIAFLGATVTVTEG